MASPFRALAISIFSASTASQTVSIVQTLIAPPLALAKAFFPSGCGRIFPLFSWVMREGLSTGPCARRPGSGL
jgi:hypothetical protein